MREWPLILFTLATQLACGLTLAATVFESKARPADTVLMRPLALAIFPAAALGILISIAHLGHPLMAWRSVVNLGQSRLSLEVILTAVFALLALAYSGFWWMGRTEGRLVLGAASSVAGIAAVMAGAALYTVPTQPAWNSGWVPASFLGTAVLLGGLAPAVLISWRGNTGLLRLFLGATVVGSLLLLIAALWMVANLSRRGYDAFTAARLTGLLQMLMSRNSLWLGCYLALVSVLPAAVAVRLWPEEGAEITPFAGAMLAAVVLGTAIGRAMMYWLGTWYEPF
jgi:anaerobic dimethyl sulfoxide reductase subunit C (anchor subunit)